MSRVGLLALALCTLFGVLAYPASALAQTDPPEGDLAFPTVNPCNWEAVAIEGFVDIDVHETSDTAGGTHFQLHALSKGQGLGAENMYVYSQELNFELNAAGPSSTEETTETINHLLTSASATQDFYLKVTFHITLVNGVATAEVTHFDTDCKGADPAISGE